jgi:hypothetical protein
MVLVATGKKKKRKPRPEAQRKPGDKKMGAFGEEDDGEVDFQTMVQKEYMKLHRQYRIMEDTRRQISGKGRSLSKKGKFLENLRKEKENLDTDIHNAVCV